MPQNRTPHARREVFSPYRQSSCRAKWYAVLTQALLAVLPSAWQRLFCPMMMGLRLAQFAHPFYG